MTTHSSVLAWRIPGTGKPCGLPSMGSHRVGHDWSDLAAAAAVPIPEGKSRTSEDKENCHLVWCPLLFFFTLHAVFQYRDPLTMLTLIHIQISLMALLSSMLGSQSISGSPWSRWAFIVTFSSHLLCSFAVGEFSISFNRPGMLKSIQLNLWRCKLWGQINSDLAPKPLEMPLAFCCPMLRKNDYFLWPIQSVISPPSKLLTSFSFQMLAREGVGLIFEFKVSFEPWGMEKGQERSDTRDLQYGPWTIVPPASSPAPLNCFLFFFFQHCLLPAPRVNSDSWWARVGLGVARELTGAMLNPEF